MMNKMAYTLVPAVNSFEFGAVAEPKDGRNIGLMLAVDAPAQYFESWEGLIATNTETLQGWIGWMKNQQQAFNLGKKLGSFQLMGIMFDASSERGRTGRELTLNMPTQQLLFIKGLRWEGNPVLWPNWKAPMKTIRHNLEKALANKAELVPLAVSYRERPTEVVPYF